MLLRLDAKCRMSLEDPTNFRAFKLVVEGTRDSLDQVRTALAGMVELPDAETAWVRAPALRAFHPTDAEWQEGLNSMIEKARPHGWIHPDTGAIRAHVEWAAEASS